MDTNQRSRGSGAGVSPAGQRPSGAGVSPAGQWSGRPRLLVPGTTFVQAGGPPHYFAAGTAAPLSGVRRISEHLLSARRTISAILSCLLATALLSPAADPADELVQMCHNGVTITVQRRFVPRRQALGDTLGPCDCCNGRTGIVFDKETYNVAPGQPFTAKVAICPAPAAGLFSFGVEVILSGNVTGTGLSSTVPVPLNFSHRPRCRSRSHGAGAHRRRQRLHRLLSRTAGALGTATHPLPKR